MADLVMIVIFLTILVSIAFLRLLWFILTELFNFIKYIFDGLTRPSPEKKMQKAVAQGSREIHEATNAYRHQVQEILEDV